ncbi:c2H2-type domain-containing protein [Nephila pilipes]|uniref:C2H2-type domain-containing protein n=1 Tax=Nephila pilipes TaxID=299642 RepID=A0A8X6NIF4_NEPPI|nr:c2H2-type domain-containing protein [Nephila pilipes]
MDNTCFLCDKSFSTASNLRRHARLTHNVENKVSTCRQMKCNVCSEELVSMKALLDHVESAHNIAIEKETKKFDFYEAFKIWKEDVEKQTTALYVKNTGRHGKDSGRMQITREEKDELA